MLTGMSRFSIQTQFCFTSPRRPESFYRLRVTRHVASFYRGWLMFVATGVGPYSGQSVHFRNFAPEKIEYAITRYVFEAQRHFGILDARLAKQEYMLGDVSTIVDMDVWGWARLIPTVLGEAHWSKFPNLKRLVDEITARPAGQRAAE